MIIRLDTLKGRPRDVAFEESFTAFPALIDLADQGVEFTAPIAGRLTANWAGDVIEVSGRVTTSVRVPCSRCLEPVAEDYDLAVQLCYSLKARLVAEQEAEVELDADDLGLIPISGDEIDLRPEIEQEVIMALPQQALCQEACSGLCPVCGHNLNHSDCRCERPVFHAGLAALKDLKIDK